MSPTRRRIAAVTVVLTSAALGVVTDLMTEDWDRSLIAAFSCLVVLSAALALYAAWRPNGVRTRVKQVTKGKDSSIAHSPVTAGDGAHVAVKATRGGKITRSSTEAVDADVSRLASGGLIKDADISAGP